MAGAKEAKKRVVRKVSFTALHRFAAGISLLAFGVVVAAGLMADARIITIAYRSAVVILMVSLISRVVVGILASYEEINSGKA